MRVQALSLIVGFCLSCGPSREDQKETTKEALREVQDERIADQRARLAREQEEARKVHDTCTQIVVLMTAAMDLDYETKTPTLAEVVSRASRSQDASPTLAASADPWGTDLKVSLEVDPSRETLSGAPVKTLFVVSAGPDMKHGTDDDVTYQACSKLSL